MLAVLMQQDSCVMSIQHTADEAEMAHGTAYRILERFLHEGLVSRQERTGNNNRSKFYYRLTPRGRAVAQRILQYMPNPIEALTAWLVQEGPKDAAAPRGE